MQLSLYSSPSASTCRTVAIGAHALCAGPLPRPGHSANAAAPPLAPVCSPIPPKLSACSTRSWRLHLQVISATVSTGGSESGNASGEAALQPRPQVKRPRLAAGGDAPLKPRRWHKVGSPAPPPAGAAPEPSAQQHQGQSEDHQQQGQQRGRQEELERGEQSGSGEQAGAVSLGLPPASGRGSSSSSSSRGAVGDGRGRQGGRGQSGAQPRQQQQAQQQQAQQQRTQRGTAPQYHRDDMYDDDEDGEDDDEDGELLGLSLEEMEEMVFASAGKGGGAGATTGTGGDDGAGGAVPGSAGATGGAPAAVAAAGGRKQSPIATAVAAAKGMTADDAVAAAKGLMPDLQQLVLAAAQSDRVSGDGEVLTSQLRQLVDAAAKALAAARSSSAGSGAASAAATAEQAPPPSTTGDVIHASVKAVASVLGCSTEAATAIMVNYPRYVALSEGEAYERLRFVSYQLGMDLADAQEVVRQNPVLLLVPSDPLRRKLTALANATGLKMTQAASMVTMYMFPGL